MYRKPYWSFTVKFYVGAFSIAVDPAMPILGGLGIRFNFRVYGKRYWRFKRKIKAAKARYMAKNAESQLVRFRTRQAEFVPQNRERLLRGVKT